MAKSMAWSFSRLNDFENCPKMFHSKYILKEWPKEDNSPHLIKGRRVHDKMEVALKKMQITLGGEYDDEIFPMVPVLQKIVAHAQNNNGEIYTELQKALTDKLSACSWFDKQTWVRAIFDVLIMYKDSALVIDWKTGKPSEDKGQLALFAAVVMALYPKIQSVTTSYVFIDHNKTVSKRFTRDQYEDLWHEFGDRAELIQIAVESGEWRATPNRRNCKWCKVRECEYKGGY